MTRNARRFLVIGLLLTTAVQIGLAMNSYYLDSDDFFVLNMGSQVAADPTDSDHFTRFWSQEPTWRPLMTLNAGLNYGLWGTDPTPRGLIVVAMHLWCALLLHACLLYVVANPMVPAVAAVLYSAHPLHAETLVWLHSGHEGVPVTLAILLSVWAYASGRATWVGLFLFQCALFVRENALCVPLLLVGVSLVQRRSFKRAIKSTWPYWLLLAINTGFRLALIGTDDTLSAGMSFHWVENPFIALATTLLHPWLPIHPAVEYRVLLCALFLFIVGGLVFSQRQRSFRIPLIAVLGLCICALPFLPQFHAAHRFFEALPGGIEQRWYFFHLPLAALMIWPAWSFCGNDAPRWGPVAAGVMVALFVTVQAVNASWWIQRCNSTKAVVAALDAAFKERPAAVGLLFEPDRDDAESADKVFLNFRTLWPDVARRQVRAFHRRLPDGALEESIDNQVYGAQWRDVRRQLPEVSWWQWNSEVGKMEKLP